MSGITATTYLDVDGTHAGCVVQDGCILAESRGHKTHEGAQAAADALLEAGVEPLVVARNTATPRQIRYGRYGS